VTNLTERVVQLFGADQLTESQMEIDIVPIISKYVQLTKTGPGYYGVCPFCGAGERWDFTVSVRYQKFSCKRCGLSGGIFKFLLCIKTTSIEDALNEVREIFGIPLQSHFLDSQWTKILKGTDFQQVLNLYATNKAPIFGGTDLREAKHFSKEEPISYTELATYIRCPLEYKMRYHDKLNAYVPTGTHVNVGRFLHLISSQFLTESLPNRTSSFIEMKFEKEINTSASAEYIGELRRFLEPTSMLLLRNFADACLSNMSPHFVTQFESFAIVGTVDALVETSEGTEIIEFKEYDYRDANNATNSLRYLQLLFYYFGLQERGKNITGGTYGFFDTGRIDHIIFSKAIVDETKTFLVNELHELVDCEDFRAIPNRLCISCGYKNECKSYKRR
jgi:hypothetical protein